MAKWDKLTSRGNVEDRRGSGALVLGGVGATGLVLSLVFNLLTGGSATDILGQLNQMPVQTEESGEFAGEDNYEVFASTVLGSANDAWTGHFSTLNKDYQQPRLVLFREATQGSCGLSTSEIGPHYCPLDSTIYLDETFFDELTLRLGAQGGDVAEAYVIAHEVGHHVQNQLGVLSRAAGSNEDSVKLELQADCYAGLWAYSIRDRGVFLPNEIEEAMDAAAAVGDDRIQKKLAGQVNPETWTHGSSQQRMEWFTRGYESGDVARCDTF